MGDRGGECDAGATPAGRARPTDWVAITSAASFEGGVGGRAALAEDDLPESLATELFFPQDGVRPACRLTEGNSDFQRGGGEGPPRGGSGRS